MLELTPAHARQLLHRAKARIAERRPRFTADPKAKRDLAERFTTALASGDAEALRAFLPEDTGFWGDGGGKVVAAKRPILGRDGVLNVLLGIRRVAAAQGLLPDVRIAVVDVNFEPALAVRLAGRLDSIYALEIDEQAIRNIRVIRNPDKLAFIDRQLATSRASQ
jgi:RNA polymerase sigma-70 factor (ECF subfamily)